ncbi:glycosyltransferase family 2 protein [Mycetocola zhadangensis]|uniref:Glycosyltransferase family 2 protein n=1 Tax=Mycetocola zhadangensis TaxID=1164595 RepID=A0A3L7J7U6_9MICO|nr:glycosyltransferase family 2 protein [Mycetocola zhadangensis]RLQ84572.1 glycosyltransferase family 2 protein [Mycetocola zhadangensis]GGE91763.1 glycosyl transferase [Mycetocola zhadangensis]
MTLVGKTEGLDARIKVRPRNAGGPPATVSVVITCFNYGRFLSQAVRSAVAQEGVIVDVVIVDDASTDDSLATARFLEREDQRVKVLAHDKNEGVVQAFNNGAALATGEFVVRLDADDVLVPGSLYRATQVGRVYPSVGLIYGHPLHFEGTTLPTPRLNPTGWTVWPGREWLADRCRSGSNVITSPEVVMRRSVLTEIGVQAPLSHTHDMEYWLRFAAFSDVAYVRGADQAWHREHSASLSATQVDPLKDMRGRIDAFETLFAGAAGSIPAVRSLAPVAAATLARQAVSVAQHELDQGLPDPAIFEAYLAMARTLDGTVTSSPEWARILRTQARRASSTRPTLGSFARRLRGRVQTDIRWHRWHKEGVY